MNTDTQIMSIFFSNFTKNSTNFTFGCMLKKLLVGLQNKNYISIKKADKTKTMKIKIIATMKKIGLLMFLLLIANPCFTQNLSPQDDAIERKQLEIINNFPKSINNQSDFKKATEQIDIFKKILAYFIQIIGIKNRQLLDGLGKKL